MGSLENIVKKACKFLDASEFPSAIKVIDEELDAELKVEFGKIIKDHEIPETIRSVIHYTSIGVLMSLLKRPEKEKEERVSLRAYDAVHFNDPNEGRLLKNLIPDEYEWLKTSKEPRAFVASFVACEEEDDFSDNLMLWRHYGKEGEGCSLSIPVNGEGVQEKFKMVKYGENLAQDAMQKIERILKNIAPLTDPQRFQCSSLSQKLCDVVSENFDQIRYLYKHEAYRHENECRIVINEHEAVEEKRFEYRERNASFPKIKCYLEPDYLDMRKVLITGSVITLGPTVPYAKEYMKEDLEKYLKRTNLYGPKVEVSGVSYRKY